MNKARHKQGRFAQQQSQAEEKRKADELKRKEKDAKIPEEEKKAKIEEILNLFKKKDGDNKTS